MGIETNVLMDGESLQWRHRRCRDFAEQVNSWLSEKQYPARLDTSNGTAVISIENALEELLMRLERDDHGDIVDTELLDKIKIVLGHISLSLLRASSRADNGINTVLDEVAQVVADSIIACSAETMRETDGVYGEGAVATFHRNLERQTVLDRGIYPQVAKQVAMQDTMIAFLKSEHQKNVQRQQEKKYQKQSLLPRR